MALKTPFSDPSLPLTEAAAKEIDNISAIGALYAVGRRTHALEQGAAATATALTDVATDVTAVSGLLDAQSVSISLGPDAAASRYGYWRSPGYEVEVTGAFVSAGSNITSTEPEEIDVSRLGSGFAIVEDVQTKAIANAMLAMVLSTGASRLIPPNTLVKAEYLKQGTVTGGIGLTVHLTFKPTGN